MRSRCHCRSSRSPSAAGAIFSILLALVTPLLFAQTPAPNTASLQGGIIHGLVKSGNMPLPGVTVTAVNTLTGQKAVAWTDVDGTYALQVPADGRYVIRTQLAAFAPLTHEVVINASNRDASVDLEMVLLSRAQHAAPGAPAARDRWCHGCCCQWWTRLPKPIAESERGRCRRRWRHCRGYRAFRNARARNFVGERNRIRFHLGQHFQSNGEHERCGVSTADR